MPRLADVDTVIRYMEWFPWSHGGQKSLALDILIAKIDRSLNPPKPLPFASNDPWIKNMAASRLAEELARNPKKTTEWDHDRVKARIKEDGTVETIPVILDPTPVGPVKDPCVYCGHSWTDHSAITVGSPCLYNADGQTCFCKEYQPVRPKEVPF